MEFNLILNFIDAVFLQMDFFGMREGPLGTDDPMVKGVIASIHSTATQWQHTFRIEIAMKNALIELKGILSGTKSYGKESLRIIERSPKSSSGYKIKNQYYFSQDNSWKDEIDEFANIILKKLSVKTGNIYDALKVMNMVEKIYRADKKK